jgi:hypothetical protein
VNDTPDHHEARGAHDVAAAHDAHDDQPLGPIDWPAWRAALLGIVVGAMICVLLYLAIR